MCNETKPFGALDDGLQVRDSQIVRETWEQFKTRVIKTLYNVSVDYVNNIITSMPKRIHAVLQADGFRTKY